MNTIYEEYAQIRELNKSISNTKRRLINSIMKIVRPYLWESGYVKHRESGALKIIAWDSNKYYKIKGVSFELGGFTEDADIITDAYGGGLATCSLSSLSIHELIKIWSWVVNNKKKIETTHN